MSSTKFVASPHTKFPNIGTRVFSEILGLLGVSVLSHFISRRVRLVDVSSLHGIKEISLPRFLTVVTFCDSWAFLFTSSVLVHGLGLELSHAICAGGVAICIAFYATSKIFIFLFLSEKVHIVWSSAGGIPRCKSPTYLVCAVLVLMYSVVGINLIFQRVAYFRDPDRVCVIGLKRAGSLSLLIYDAFINITLLCLFLWPLLRARVRSLYLRSIALRAVVACFFTLSSSIINVFVLTLMEGQQRGWICLASCGADIIANATVIFWATSGSSMRPQPPSPRDPLGPADGAFMPNGAFTGVAPGSGSASSSQQRPSESAPTFSSVGPILIDPASVQFQRVLPTATLNHGDFSSLPTLPSESAEMQTVIAGSEVEEGLKQKEKEDDCSDQTKLEVESDASTMV